MVNRWCGYDYECLNSKEEALEVYFIGSMGLKEIRSIQQNNGVAQVEA